MNTFLLYRIARYILCAGTAFEAFRQISKLMPGNLFGIFITLFLGGLLVLLFEGSAFTYWEQIARHFTGQKKLTGKTAIMVTGTLGTLAFVGGAAFSLLSVPAVSSAMVEDKSGAYIQMQSAKEKADQSFANLVASADADIARAEKELKDAQEKKASARKDGIKAQGGEFARLAGSGNAWAWTADAPFSRERKGVAAYEKQAAADVQAAWLALAETRKVKQQLLTAGRVEHYAGLKEILGAGKVTVENWQTKLMQSNRIVLYVVIAAMIFSIIFLLKMATDGDVPEFKDLTEVLADSYEIAFGAIIAGLSGTNNQARKVMNMGIVSPSASVPPAAAVPSPVPPVVPRSTVPRAPYACPPKKYPAVPVETVPRMRGDKKRTKYPEHIRRQMDKLKGNIKKYNGRMKDGTLKEESLVTLAAWQKELAELKKQYNARP